MPLDKQECKVQPVLQAKMVILVQPVQQVQLAPWVQPDPLAQQDPQALLAQQVIQAIRVPLVY